MYYLSRKAGGFSAGGRRKTALKSPARDRTELGFKTPPKTLMAYNLVGV
jgi:hypothetical protein